MIKAIITEHWTVRSDYQNGKIHLSANAGNISQIVNGELILTGDSLLILSQSQWDDLCRLIYSIAAYETE